MNRNDEENSDEEEYDPRGLIWPGMSVLHIFIVSHLLTLSIRSSFTQ